MTERKSDDLGGIFGPLEIEAVRFGTIRIPIRKARFLVWYEQHSRDNRWANDGKELVRDILREQADIPTSEGKRSSLPPEAVDALDEQDLEQIASSIVEKIGRTLIRARDPESRSEPDRKGGKPEFPHGSSSARLLAIIDEYYIHHCTLARKAFDQLAKSDSISAIQRALAEISRFKLGIETFSTASTPSRLLAERSLRQFGLPDPTSFMNQQKLIGEAIAAMTRPRPQLVAPVVIIERFEPLISPALHKQILGSQLAWLKTINTAFRLTLSTKAWTETMNSVRTAEASTRFIAEAHFDRVGFETTANLALDGLIAPGAAAGLLDRYAEDPALHGPIFNEVLEAVRSLDGDESSIDPAAAAERAWHAIRSKISTTLPHPSKAALYNLAMLVLAVAAVLIALQALREQRRANQSQALAPILKEVRAMHAEAKAARASDADAIRHLRYVHSLVNLRSDPGRGGLIIRVVYPDQIVRVIDTKGGWALVEVFDYGSEAPVRGWLSRRALRQIPAN